MKRLSVVLAVLIATGACLGTDVGNPSGRPGDQIGDASDDFGPHDMATPDVGYDAATDMGSEPGVDALEDAAVSDVWMDALDLDLLFDSDDLPDCDFDWDVCGDTEIDE